MILRPIMLKQEAIVHHHDLGVVCHECSIVIALAVFGGIIFMAKIFELMTVCKEVRKKRRK